MKDSILVSIITSCYNSEDYIEDCIKSVLNQTYEHIEYIIVDGESNDRTLDIIKEYESEFEGRMKWISEEDEGLYDAMNKGIEMATGNVIGFLNSDDLYASNKVIEKVAKTFNDNLDLDSCYCDIVYVDQKDTDLIKRIWSSSKGIFSRFKYGWTPPHPGFFARKKLFEKYGKFDLAFSISADFDLLCRFIAKHGASINYLPEIGVKMREGGVSNEGMAAIIKGNKEAFLALKKNNIFPYFVFLKPFRKLFQIIKAKLFSFKKEYVIRK